MDDYNVTEMFTAHLNRYSQYGSSRKPPQTGLLGIIQKITWMKQLKM